MACAIGGWLAERQAGIEARHRFNKPGPLARDARLKVWFDYLEVLRDIKILDPACGSGEPLWRGTLESGTAGGG